MVVSVRFYHSAVEFVQMMFDIAVYMLPID